MYILVFLQLLVYILRFVLYMLDNDLYLILVFHLLLKVKLKILYQLQHNDNFHLMVNYNWEGIVYDHNFIVLHSKLHQYKIPHNKVVFSFAGYNIRIFY